MPQDALFLLLFLLSHQLLPGLRGGISPRSGQLSGRKSSSAGAEAAPPELPSPTALGQARAAGAVRVTQSGAGGKQKAPFPPPPDPLPPLPHRGRWFLPGTAQRKGQLRAAGTEGAGGAQGQGQPEPGSHSIPWEAQQSMRQGRWGGMSSTGHLPALPPSLGRDFSRKTQHKPGEISTKGKICQI